MDGGKFTIFVLLDGAQLLPKDPKTFVAVLLSFIYATPTELGFDPNIRECTPTQGDPQNFIYTVNDDKRGPTYFKTLESLSEYRSRCISGRATRVWKAIQIKSLDDHLPLNGGKKVVLKDIWLEQGAKTERQLQTNLFTDIGEFIKRTLPVKGVPELKSAGDIFEALIRDILVDERWKKHFLTIIFDGIGDPCKECPISARPDPTIFNEHLNPPDPPRSQAANHSRAYSTSVLHEHTSSTNVAPVAPRKFVPKRRYIVVFEELCEAVEDATSFPDVMKAMNDVAKG